MKQQKSKIMLLQLLVVCFCCNKLSASFLDFFKPGSGAPEVLYTADDNAVRGVPEHLHSKYLTDPFECDGGQKYSVSVVNDGYCDCADGSDEPGTAACEESVFHCVNKGYKVTRLPSSRVDDQICDCCDGSDEGIVIKCPNTCKQAAEREKAAMAKVSQNYRVGSAVRQKLEEKVRQEKGELLRDHDSNVQQQQAVEEEIKGIEQQMQSLQQVISGMEQKVYAEQQQLIREELRLEALSFQELAMLISQLFKVLDVSNSRMYELVDIIGPARDGGSNTESAAAAVAEDDDDDDRDTIAAAGAAAADGGDSTAEDSDEDAASCQLVDLANGDFSLLPLCGAAQSAADAVQLLLHFLSDPVAMEQKGGHFTEVVLLLGFNAKHGSLEGGAEYVQQQLATGASAQSCPADFATLDPHYCRVLADMSSMVQVLKAAEGLTTITYEKSELEKNRNIKLAKKKVLSDKISSASSAKEDLQKYGAEGQLALLAMKDECVEVKDGNYEYSLCVMDKVTQKELGGRSSQVTLGKFKSMHSSTPAAGDAHSIVMKYDGGQYCHAFGARSATVLVTCGSENRLLSAAEPSTCAYELQMESPAACTTQYAHANGIAIDSSGNMIA